ncbi:MAG: DRTGG domain-containing protein [Candidatus Saliniplasma sp.]
MKNLIIASTRPDAGKTTVGIAIAMLNKDTFNYLKPFGDRPIYKKKRLIDYDAKLFKNILNLKEDYEKFCIGFDHSKIKYAYDQETIKEKIKERIDEMRKTRDSVIIETGDEWSVGSSIHLDPVSIYEYTDSEVIIVATGNRTDMIDDLHTVSKYFQAQDIPIRGVVLNKVESVDDIQNFAVDEIESLGMEVIGIIPEIKELSLTRVSFINDMLFGKIVAGEDGLNNLVENVFVGAMSAEEIVRNPHYQKRRKLVITGGDRSDVVLASLDEDTSGVILTNDIIPPSNIISRADRAGIPLISVPLDTYEAARRIERMDKITTIEDDFKIKRIREDITPNIHIDFD